MLRRVKMDYPEPPLDDVKRLTVMILLERNSDVGFTELYRMMGISKGALDSHLRVLEREELVYRERRFIGNSLRVFVRVTGKGLNKLQRSKIAWRRLLEE